MKKPLIKRVDDNSSKGKTYSALIFKYKEAIESGYYGEAELIVYALLEDRLRSFIYYSNLLDHWNSNKINNNAEIICGGSFDIKNISSKITVIGKALKVCSKKNEVLNPFEKDLKKSYTAVFKVGELKKKLDKIGKWIKFRNEVIHAMFNKDLEDLRQSYKCHVEEGMTLARYIDGQVKNLKKA